MTTVVANLEGMAADHRCTSEGPICHTPKIFRVNDRLYGLCGDVMMALYVVEWLQGKRDMEALHKAIGPEYRANVTIMELSSDGLALIDGWGMRMQLMDKFYAIGSGAAPALIEMKHGASLQDAVRASATLDEASGMHPDHPPQIEWLLPPELLPKRRKRKG